MQQANQPTPETDYAMTCYDAKGEYVYADFARKLERERDGALATLQYVTGQLIEARRLRGPSPVEKMARRAVLMSKERDQLHAENEQLRASGRFTIGQRVLKTKGSAWSGTIVGTYTTALTPEGYCVESDTHAGSVQIYPANALEAL